MELLESIKNMVLPFIEQHDCYLDDIEYVKDGNDMYLRIYIEKNEGYLDMDTCVAVSELISDKLDEVDPIKTDTSDSKYLFDSEDAIVFNFKKPDNK